MDLYKAFFANHLCFCVVLFQCYSVFFAFETPRKLRFIVYRKGHKERSKPALSATYPLSPIIYPRQHRRNCLPLRP